MSKAGIDCLRRFADTTVQNLIISLTDVNDEIPHLAEESLQLQEITNEEADGQVRVTD